MKIQLIAVGTKMPAWVERGFEEYRRRFPKDMPFELVEIGAGKRGKNADIPRILQKEGEAMLAAALQCAAEIASKPPVAIWGTKQVIHYTRDHSVEDSLRQMGWVQGAIWSNAHVREAVSAMKQKRDGQFTPLSPLKRFTDLV